MRSALLAAYDKLVLNNPVLVILITLLVAGFFAYQAPAFKLDASADSLVLENDQALKYYRSIRARYGSDEFLVITYTPTEDLFSDKVLADLNQLKQALLKLERVDSVVSILDVPLTQEWIGDCYGYRCTNAQHKQ